VPVLARDLHRSLQATMVDYWVDLEYVRHDHWTIAGDV
jgi:hypothetical protein